MKELGFEQDSLFWWCKSTKFKDKDFVLQYGTPAGIWETKPLRKWLDGTMYAAYTVAELGEMLPAFYTSWKTAGTWECADEQNIHRGQIATAYTEANARAMMCIWLRKEGYI